MELSIIIVNYRTAGLILDCLETVYTQSSDLEFEVFVVDNDSGDDSRERILNKYPQIRWIQMGYNSGFARANNAAIRLAAGEAILLLNPDTLIEDNAITACYRLFKSSPYVACGVQLLNEDKTPQITGSYFMRGGLNYLLPLPFLGNWIKAVANTFKVARPSIPEATGLVEVHWINGAFLMVRRTAWEKAGLMDEDFFLYAEEIEWCSRLHKEGPIAVYGHLHIIHLQGASANMAFGSEGSGYYNLFDTKGLQIMLSNFVRIRKQLGISWFLFHFLVYLAEMPIFLVGIVFSRRFSLAQFHGYCSNMMRLTRLIPTIIRNKPYLYKVI
ncbi:MAG TPA: glycosyltransferase family 2 protein [Puia sp.]|nr:glycosyltransferase family 2 protein [Puia sp.]